jgi:O-antigen ligase
VTSGPALRLPLRLQARVALPAPALMALAVAGALVGLIVGQLVLAESYQLALAAALAPPIAVVVWRRPLLAIPVWLLLAPLVMAVDGTSARRVYWLVHRALPFVALAALLVRPMLVSGLRSLPRPGLPELLMGGYLAATLASIAYTSPTPVADAFVLYDRVFIPMTLYLLIRFSEPDDNVLRRWLPVLAVLVISQAVFGVLSWVAPELLPDPWLNRVGNRTTGSLSHANVYAISLLFAAVLSLHLGSKAPRGTWQRRIPPVLFAIAVFMAVVTLSRAAWLAALVVAAAVAWVRPRTAAAVLMISVAALTVVLQANTLTVDGQLVSDRLYSQQSEQSALSRVPVVVGSLRMFEERPVEGWGYNRFDEVNWQFQRGIDRLYVPDKQHASHNLYLTILAEQGLLGLVLYLGPAVVLLARARRLGVWRARAPDRALAVGVCAVLVGHAVISQFSNMRVPFGLGVWWICLGLLATVIARAQRSSATRPTSPQGPSVPLRRGPE